MTEDDHTVFKICTAAEWAEAVAAGAYQGSAADRRDGFIHLSTAAQLEGTAAKHFAGLANLVLVAIPASALPDLRWEPSRGGALFPHAYSAIPAGIARWVKALPLVAEGHRFPAGVLP